jgi:hypothetical protein
MNIKQMGIIAARQETKLRQQRYRDAAARLFPGVSIRPLCTVNETAGYDGAFLEVVIWIPRTEVEPKTEELRFHPDAFALVMRGETCARCQSYATWDSVKQLWKCFACGDLWQTYLTSTTTAEHT